MRYYVLFLLVICSSPSWSQGSDRIRPGHRYGPGDKVTAPAFGFTSKIPDGWEGVLPRESETFLLLPVNGTNGSIYVFGNTQDNIEALGKRWQTGLDMGGGIFLKASGKLTPRGAAWAAEGVLSGSTNRADRKMYAEALCGNHGVCITYLMQSDPANFQQVKRALQAFVDATSLEEPREVSLYEGFDWKTFLSGKVVMTWFSSENERSKNEVHLCADGTFRSTLKRSGLLKEEIKPYQGTRTGTWEVTTGQKATLTLRFKDLPAAQVELYIDDEKVYANGSRHFVGASERCKP